jgi:hypothetical protein
MDIVHHLERLEDELHALREAYWNVVDSLGFASPSLSPSPSPSPSEPLEIG